MANNIHSRMFSLIIAAGLILSPPALFAEEILSANDLDPATLTEKKTVGGFTLLATAEKGISIDALTDAATAEDGEIFNCRVNLKGGGSVDYRAISFKAKAKAEITVHALSSSKTDTRVLAVVNAATGVIVAELNAPPYEGNKAKVFSVLLADPGEYLLYSKSGGMYIYQIVIK